MQPVFWLQKIVLSYTKVYAIQWQLKFVSLNKQFEPIFCVFGIRHSAVSSQHSVCDLCATDLIKKHDIDIIMAKLLCVLFFIGFHLISMDFHPESWNSFYSFVQKSLIRKGPKYLESFFQCWILSMVLFIYSNVNANVNVNVIFIISPLSHTPIIGFYFYHPTIPPHSIQNVTRNFHRNNSHRWRM